MSEYAASGTLEGAAVTTSDPEGDKLTYSLAASRDSDQLTVDSVIGKLSEA